MNDQRSQEKLFGKYQEIAMLLLGFLLTSVVGGFIGTWFQRRSWAHEHLVQVCDAERDTASKGLASLSDLMDKRLLRMRQLAWKLERAHAIGDAEEERKANREARDAWSMRLNGNLSFTERYFGSQARNNLEVDIAGGFGKIHNEFNDLFESGKLDKVAIARIEADIDDLNPTIYTLTLK